MAKIDRKRNYIGRYGPGCKILKPCAMCPLVQNTPLDIGHRAFLSHYTQRSWKFSF